MHFLEVVLEGIVPAAFGILFLAGGVSKCLRISSVFHIISNYRLLPDTAAHLASYLLGPAEAVTGLLFLTAIFLPVYKLAWAATTGMLLVFSFAILSALLRGLKIPCGCGILLNGHVIRWTTLLRNLLLLTILAIDLLIKVHFLGLRLI